MAATEAILRCAGPLDREREEVTGVAARRVQQRIEQLVLAGPPLDVDVSRAPGSSGQPQVEGETSLQQPSLLGDGDQPSEQAVKGDALAGAGKARTVPFGTTLKRCSSACRNAVASWYLTLALRPGGSR